MNLRELFLLHNAQTSQAPLAIEVVKAEDCRLYDVNGKEYIDLIGGISVANTGHRHPKVIEAIKRQLDNYLHVMVYGEFVQSPQVQYACLLCNHLPSILNSVYFTNSGAEAVEGAMKLAKKFTGRSEIIAYNNAYHGSTQGALSIIGSEYWRQSFRPLLPGILHLNFNSYEELDYVTGNTACVIVETIQGEAGIIAPDQKWIQALREQCSRTGSLLIFDEIQAGFGRTGKLWGFEHFDVVPDILLLGKALGGGMPLGAFIADHNMMAHLSDNPVLGHITTFGGHPVSCVAGLAAFQVLFDEDLMKTTNEKSAIFKKVLQHKHIEATRSFGLWLAVEFKSAELCKRVVDECIVNGVLTDWFLFAPHCLRISPPLTISEEEIKHSSRIILQAVDKMTN
ncbi:MAG: aspartate aminotransferase family protein [Flavisolibacter sp.]